MSIKTLQGDNRETLATLPESSIHMAVTSPPYWALRSYLPADSPLKGFELGQEPTPELFIENLVDVFRSVRRVLRDDGTLWVNLGDSYAASGMGGNPEESEHRKQATNAGSLISGRKPAEGLKPLDRVGIPERFALAMQQDGWYWRDVIVWRKPAPMPISVNGWRWEKCRVKVKGKYGPDNPHPSKTNGINYDRGNDAPSAVWSDCPGCKKCDKNDGYVLRKGSWRTTAAHEYIFMFAKTASYFCDAEAMKVPSNPAYADREHKPKGSFNGKLDDANSGNPNKAFRAVSPSANPRSVWTINTEPLKAKHYAAFPSELPRRCIRAGTPDKGCCPECGAPWARIVDKTRTATRPGNDTKITGDRMNDGNRDAQRHVSESRTVGWRPTCGCDAGEPVPCVVLDPFGGSGTTGLVGQMMGRDVVLCELNPEYIDIQRDRCEETAPLLLSVESTPTGTE